MNNKELTSESSMSKVQNRYSDSKGTGVLGTLIFAVVVTVIMVVVAHIKGF